jgi:uncharacterized protein with PQ loop repeat
VTLTTLLLSTAITVLAFPGAWIQLRLLKRKGTSEGLSPVFVALGTSSCASWFFYGFLDHEPLQIVVNSSSAVAQFLTLMVMAGFSPRLRPAVFAVGAYLALIGVAGYFLGAGVCAVAGTALSTFCRFPQVYKSWKEPGGVAVSVSNFMLTVATAALWVVFGCLHGDAFVVMSAALSVALTSYIIFRTVYTGGETGSRSLSQSLSQAA